MDIGYFDEICSKLEASLNHSRYVHTLGVAFTASALAMRYFYDSDKALLAGLLHDCAKCFPTEEKLSLCEEGGVELTDIEVRNPALIHAKLGAYIAQRDYGVDDPEILDAIRTHTTGCPDMTLLQKIIFTADLIEPNREDDIFGIAVTREMAFENIDRAVYMIAEDSLRYLATKPDKELDPMTVRTYEFYKQLCGR